MLLVTYYAFNYAGIIGLGLPENERKYVTNIIINALWRMNGSIIHQLSACKLFTPVIYLWDVLSKQ